MTEDGDRPKIWQLLSTVLLPFALGFFLSNYFRSVNAVLSPRLIDDMRLTAGDLGLLSAIYFFASALFQVPLGILMDHYGPRRVQAFLISIAGFGVLLFTFGPYWPIVLLGRAAMGIGTAGALMTSFQAVTLWFPQQRWPLFNGLILSVGGLGALTATLPTEWMLQVTGWRQLMIGVAVTSFVLSASILAIIPDHKALHEQLTLKEQLRGIKVVYSDPLFWRIAPLHATTVGATLAFQTLWAGPWLKDVARLGPSEVAADLLAVTVMQIVIFLAFGFLVSLLGRWRITPMQIIGVGSLLFILSQSALLLPSGSGRWIVLIGMGSLANMNLLTYPILARHFPIELMGRVSTAVNVFVFVSAFVLQYAVGILIGLFTPAAFGSYPEHAYQTAFGLIVIIQAISWLWYMYRRN